MAHESSPVDQPLAARGPVPTCNSGLGQSIDL